MIGSRTNAVNPPWWMLVGWSLRSKVIGQEDHGLNFGATGSNAVLESTLPLPFGDVGCVYHVHRPHLRGEALLSSVVWRPGPLLVVAMQPLVSGFGT